MNRKTVFSLLLIWGLLFSAILEGAELTLLLCRKLSQPPRLDGKLNDECWENVAGVPLVYLRNAPPEVRLETTVKLGFDENALYLAAFCYKKDPKTLKAAVTRRGDLNLWTDDCIEIYLDTDNTPVSFNYFAVNALGTQADDRKNSLGDRSTVWAPEENKKWQAAANIGEDGWSVEVMIPWENLGKQACTGDVWTFAVIRFDWGTENWIAATSSPGALSNAKESFGFLVFTDNGQILEDVIHHVSACGVGHQPGMILGENGVFVYEDYQGEMNRRLTDIFSALEQCRILLRTMPEGSSLVTNLDNLEREVKELRRKMEMRSPPGPADWHIFAPCLRKISLDLEELKTAVSLRKLLSSSTN